jgi:hypothetical protein
MYSLSPLVSILAAVCLGGGLSFSAEAADVAATNSAILRYMVDTPKHKVETSEEHRKEELDGFLKTGKMPSMSEEKPVLPKKDTFKKGMVDTLQSLPTEVLMKQYLEGGNRIKDHLDATGRGRGPDKTKSPAKSPSAENGKNKVPSPKVGNDKGKTPSPTKSPKDEKGKMTKGKVDSSTKAPKLPKKGSKKSKGDKESYGSDYPSTSPTPTLPPVKGDVVLPPSFDAGTLVPLFFEHIEA